MFQLLEMIEDHSCRKFPIPFLGNKPFNICSIKINIRLRYYQNQNHIRATLILLQIAP